MDKLDIKGGEFVKAKVLAREFGYTSDYIGQLCRSGKVDGQLVGRTWYIDRQSLIDHKENRYKKSSSHTSAKQPPAKPNFYERAEKSVNSTYDWDESDLIPQVNKTSPEKPATKLPVNLADAKTVSVSSKNAGYDFTVPEKHETVFKGDLVVEAIPEPEFEEETVSSQPQAVKVRQQAETKQTKAVHTEVEGDNKAHAVKVHVQKRPQKIKQRLAKAAAPARIPSSKMSSISVTTAPTHQELPITGDSAEAEPQGLMVSYLVSSMVIASFIAFLMLGLEQRIIVTEQISFTEYAFRVGEVLASVYGSK